MRRLYHCQVSLHQQGPAFLLNLTFRTRTSKIVIESARLYLTAIGTSYVETRRHLVFISFTSRLAFRSSANRSHGRPQRFEATCSDVVCETGLCHRGSSFDNGQVRADGQQSKTRPKERHRLAELARPAGFAERA